VNVFGVDFLDFRLDITNSLATALTAPPPRTIETDAENKGIKIQFIRLEPYVNSQAIQISQVFVLDKYGNNLALYCPTRSSVSPDTSYTTVDGNYFIKPSSNAFLTPENTTTSQFLEINLTCPKFVTAVYTIGAVSGNTNTDQLRSFNLQIKLLNASRDVVCIQQGQSADSAGTLIVGDPASSFIQSVAGVNIQDQFFSRKFDQDLIPAAPSGPSKSVVTPNSPVKVNPTLNLQSPLQRGTSVHQGVRAMYVRLYNPMDYIQISQLMIFDSTLANITRSISTANVFATNALPGKYPERAIDGTDGFFHQPRSADQCYISEKKPYEYWQVNLGSLKEIVGLKYIPPASNRSRNKWLRFQLLDDNKNICAQYIVTDRIVSDTTNYNASELWVDFRLNTGTLTPIRQLCAPGLTTQTTYSAGTLFGLTQDNTGAIYATDFTNHIVVCFRYNSTTSTFSPPITIFGTSGTAGSGMNTLNSPTGIFWDSATGILFVCDYGNNRVCGLKNITGASASLSSADVSPTITAPYGVCVYNGVMFVSQYINGGKIISTATSVPTTTSAASNLSPISTLIFYPLGATFYNFLGGLAVRVEYEIAYLYATVGGSGQIICINLSTFSRDTTRDIGSGITGITGVNTQYATNRTTISLQFPTGVAVDPGTNILFFVDSVGNKVYFVPPDTSTIVRSQVYLLAGMGAAGSTDATPATKGTFDAPVICLYHILTGDVFISDINNKSLRRIVTSLTSTITSFTEHSTSPDQNLIPTTTVGGIDNNVQTPTQYQLASVTYAETIDDFAAPAMLGTISLSSLETWTVPVISSDSLSARRI
jgi:hypothetical protein